MSARDQLFRRVAGAFVTDGRANALIGAVVAEELQKAADWLMSQGHTVAARDLDDYIKAGEPRG